jgi:replicative DNA helicase
MTSFSKLIQYGLGFQIKVIGLLLTKRDFLINIIDSLESDYFENISHKWIVDYIITYYSQYHTTPSMEVLSIEIKKLDNEVLKIALTESLREAYKEADAKDVEWIQKEFTNFCTNQQIKKAIIISADLLNVGDYEGIYQIINKAVKSREDKNIGHVYEKDVESRYRDDDRNPVPFPWPVFNDLTEGGAGKGDLVLFFGNPGGGKSWACVCYAAYAAKLGYNVVYYTLELGAGYVGKRFDSVLTGIPLNQLPKSRNSIQEAVDALKGRLIIKEYPPKRASIETINAHLDQLERQEDFKADLVIIDYIDYMKTRSRKDRKEEIDDIFIEVKAMAKERQIPIISPSQANRTGAQKDILEGDTAAGSYDKIMIGDILISIARNRKNKINGDGLWHWIKNRYGPDGLTFSSKMDLTRGKIEISEIPLDDEEFVPRKKKSDQIDLDNDEIGILRNKFKSLSEGV